MSGPGNNFKTIITFLEFVGIYTWANGITGIMGPSEKKKKME